MEEGVFVPVDDSDMLGKSVNYQLGNECEAERVSKGKLAFVANQWK